MTSLRTVADNCLNKTGRLSVLQDFLGVYNNDNPTNRSFKDRLDLIQNTPFVRVVVVTVRPVGSTLGVDPNLQRDLDNANIVYQAECNAWVYCQNSIVVRTNILGNNGILDQADCKGSNHEVSMEEDQLFDLGRNMGADLVGYYIAGDVGGLAGCAAHPIGRRGFWCGATRSAWTFVHEVTHVIGDNAHVSDTDNLMMGSGTFGITNPPPDLTNNQCDRILNDSDMESC